MTRCVSCQGTVDAATATQLQTNKAAGGPHLARSCLDRLAGNSRRPAPPPHNSANQRSSSEGSRSAVQVWLGQLSAAPARLLLGRRQQRVVKQGSRRHEDSSHCVSCLGRRLCRRCRCPPGARSPAGRWLCRSLRHLAAKSAAPGRRAAMAAVAESNETGAAAGRARGSRARRWLLGDRRMRPCPTCDGSWGPAPSRPRRSVAADSPLQPSPLRRREGGTYRCMLLANCRYPRALARATRRPLISNKAC